MGVVVQNSLRGASSQEVLQIGYGGSGREAGFAQVNLVSIFESAHQFYTVQRTEVQLGIKVGSRFQSGRRTPTDSRNDFPERTVRYGSFFVSAPLLLCPGCQFVFSWLLRASSRRIFFRPNKPRVDSLVFRQRLVSFLYCAPSVGVRTRQNQDRNWF